ncbi:hypothetical protein [Bombilactobacillus thymidiniphilus]|uniref:Surface layer protein n=1 Tax=Bombilactobacillus thymidiniphilus TaxID=2923363 RepID=A0ABY4PF26_9LACO|nr:hypothetical protein [Bombilactobacillus thymidiniphilus]UQS84197.1 hypothetical protein MOO47_03330 [Bombilactobacillus thymidiniphilus]
MGIDVSPKDTLDNTDYPQVDLHTGKYIRTDNIYKLYGKTNDFSAVYFIGMDQIRKNQYYYSEGPKSISMYNVKLYFKNGKYYGTYKFRRKWYDGIPLVKQGNYIKNVKGSIFPNNSQEFLQQFHYLPLDDWKNKVNHFSK